MAEQPPISDQPLGESESTPPVAPEPPKQATLREKLWVYYISILIISGVGFGLTRASEFPLAMVLATVGYLGIQVAFQLRQISTASESMEISQRARVSTIATMVATAFALILMALSAYMFRPIPGADSNITFAAFLMLAGGVVLTIGQLFNNLNPAAERPRFEFTSVVDPFPIGYSLITTIGILLLLIEAEITGNNFKIDWFQGVSFWIQAAIFWGGVALVGIGMGGATGLPWLRSVIRRIRAFDLRWLALIAIIVLAFVLRAWALESSLPLSIDDGINIPTVWPLLADKSDIGLIITSDGHYTTQLYSQFVAITVDLFGYNFTGARLADSFAGTLGVLAVFILADALFDRKMALISALILATFPPHLQFSRVMFAQIVDATVGTFALAFVARAMRYNRRSDWAVAGVALGLTQYFFEAGRLFFPPLVVLWIVLMALFNFKSVKKFGQGLGVFIITTLLVAMPTYYAAFAKNVPFTNRLDISGVGLSFWVDLWNSGNAQQFWGRLASPFLVFVHQPEIGLYYGGSHPLVLEYLVPLFLLGVAYLLWRWRKPGIIIVLWIFGTAAGNLLMRDTAGYARYVVGLPAVAIAMGAGIAYVVPMLFASWKRRAITGVTIALLTVICVGQTLFYFDDNLPALRYAIRTAKANPDGVDAVLRLAKLPGKVEAYMISDNLVDVNPPRAVLSLYAWNRPYDLNLDDVAPGDVTVAFLNTLTLDKSYAFFVEPGHPDVVDHLKQVFVVDDPQYTTAPDMPPGKGFVLYYVELSKQHQPTVGAS